MDPPHNLRVITTTQNIKLFWGNPWRLGRPFTAPPHFYFWEGYNNGANNHFIILVSKMTHFGYFWKKSMKNKTRKRVKNGAIDLPHFIVWKHTCANVSACLALRIFHFFYFFIYHPKKCSFDLYGISNRT